MAFQISTNVSALNVYNNLTVHQTKSSASLARISSGFKSAGGGDVASQGTAATFNASLQGTQNAISQVQSALLRLQAADAAYGELIALGQKGLETVSRGADAGADFDAIEAATDAIDAGIASIIAASEFNGTALSAVTAPSVGSAPLIVTPTFTAAPAIAPGDIADASDAATEATAFGTYITGTVANRASNAGNIASLQNTLQVLNSVAANELAGIGQAQDTDIAKEMMNLTSANIMTEAATAMLAQSMQMPNSVLKLIQ